MSDFVVHKHLQAAGTFSRDYGMEVTDVKFEHDMPTAITLADGRIGAGTCIGCGSAPCMKKHEHELTLFGTLNAFPGDPNLDVCPTRAIRWDDDNAVAIVAAEDCIGCGLCISRCPYGAISMANGLTACVETNDPDGLIVGGHFEGEHSHPQYSGRIAKLDAPAASNLLNTVAALDDTRTTLLVRNLLNEIGLSIRTRRRGDTNMRIDAVGFSRDKRPFIAEIEMTTGVLESPRALLEDVAVLHSRYGYGVKDIDLVSVILAFPNVRSEYYQVIRDIEKVLGLRCHTITIGVIVAMLWNGVRLVGFTSNAFTIGGEMIDLANCLGIEEARTTEPYPGAFRPSK